MQTNHFAKQGKDSLAKRQTILFCRPTRKILLRKKEARVHLNRPVVLLGSLDILLKIAQDDYKQVTYDAKSIQVGFMRTYLWLSVAVVTAEVSLLLRFPEKIALFTLCDGLAFTCLAVALVLAFAALLLGIDLMRGREGTRNPIRGSYERNLDYVEMDKAATAIMVRKKMICDLADAIAANGKTEHRIGETLRILSRLLTGSAALGGLAFLIHGLSLFFAP